MVRAHALEKVFFFCKSGTSGDSEDPFGNTKCYATDPSKLQMGWTVKVI